MAKVVITIKDKKDGTVDVKARTDTPFQTEDADKNTSAQIWAMAALKSLIDMSGVKPGDIRSE